MFQKNISISLFFFLLFVASTHAQNTNAPKKKTPEKKEIYEQSLNERISLTVVYNNEGKHGSLDYIFYEICKKLGIPYLREITRKNIPDIDKYVLPSLKLASTPAKHLLEFLGSPDNIDYIVTNEGVYFAYNKKVPLPKQVKEKPKGGTEVKQKKAGLKPKHKKADLEITWKFKARIEKVENCKVEAKLQFGVFYSWKEFLQRKDESYIIAGCDARWIIKMKIQSLYGTDNPLRVRETIYFIIHSPTATFGNSKMVGESFFMRLNASFYHEDGENLVQFSLVKE